MNRHVVRDVMDKRVRLLYVFKNVLEQDMSSLSSKRFLFSIQIIVAEQGLASSATVTTEIFSLKQRKTGDPLSEAS